MFVVYLRRVAVILLVTVTVAFGVLMTNTEVMAAIKNTIIEWYSEYIKFNFIAGEAIARDTRRRPGCVRTD